MKKYIPNPHFLLFGFFVLIVISSGSAVKAQQEKKISQSIIIKNGDTIINGKKLNEVDKEERLRLRNDFKKMESRIKGPAGKNEKRVIIRDKNDEDVVIGRKGKDPHILFWNDDNEHEFKFNFDNGREGNVHVFKFKGDSLMLGFNADTLMKGFSFNMDGLDSNLRKRIVTMHRNLEVRAPGMRGRMMPPMMFERGEFPSLRNSNNSSSFNYNYIDKDGISNHMNISISEAEKDQLKKITGSESIVNPLDVSDITVFPNFSSGKLGLSFNVANRGNTKVKILDSDLKQVFSDETANFSGSYMKQISLPKNGVYYISISQNSNWFVKKLIKD